jgi:hypothetical protein
MVSLPSGPAWLALVPQFRPQNQRLQPEAGKPILKRRIFIRMYTELDFRLRTVHLV